MEELNLSKTTTHIVFSFVRKSEVGKILVDVVPVSWLNVKDHKLYTLYPTGKELCNLEEMSKKSSKPPKSWKAFEITILKEAGINSHKLFL